MAGTGGPCACRRCWRGGGGGGPAAAETRRLACSAHASCNEQGCPLTAAPTAPRLWLCAAIRTSVPEASKKGLQQVDQTGCDHLDAPPSKAGESRSAQAALHKFDVGGWAKSCARTGGEARAPRRLPWLGAGCSPAAHHREGTINHAVKQRGHQ